METRIDARTGLVLGINFDPEVRIRQDEIKAMIKAEMEAERRGE